MNAKIKPGVVFTFIWAFALVMLAETTAEAARWRTCNGSPVIWRGTLNVHRNRCSIPDRGNVNSAYWNGVLQWDRLSDVVDNFFVNPASDCRLRSGDGQNEVALANRSAIDGANGVTFLRLGLCFIGSNDIDEADIVLANDLSFTPRSGNFRGTTGRSTFVHEFGHFFGLLHEGAHAIMRPTPPHLLTGGFEPSTLWPSDSIGMNRLYGFTSSRADLLPSALGVTGGTVQTLDPAITVNACRGSTTTTRVYLGNLGNASSGTYGLRIRLNTTPPFRGYFLNTTVAQRFTHSIGAFSQGTFDLTFRVPRTLPNGTYSIYVDMDHTRSVAERREGDNSTLSAKRIRVVC